MNQITKTIYVLSILFFFTACSSYNKKDYLKDYEHFIIDVKSDWKGYSENDWERLAAKNRSFYETEYKKFASELWQFADQQGVKIISGQDKNFIINI